MARIKAEKIMRPLEKVGSGVKNMAWSAMIESLALLILGILLIAWPDTMMKISTYIVGAVFIVRGAYQILTYFIDKGHRDFFNNDLLVGIISVLVGIAALLIGDQIVNVFRVVIGVWIIYEALVKVNTAVKMASVKVGNWQSVLVVAILMLVLGAFVTFNVNADAYLIGWMMIIAGIVGICGGIVVVQHVNSIIDVLSGKRPMNDNSDGKVNSVSITKTVVSSTNEDESEKKSKN